MTQISHPYPGKLIAVEGLDGSGKSTQIYLLKRWLEMQNMKVFFTQWNSSKIVKAASSKGKKRQLLTPTTFSLIHATDFADRYEQEIAPLLRAGYIVLSDRYVYTAYVRDMTRGCSKNWVKNLYSFAVKPDITFYFDVPLSVSLDRILSGRPELKYFEAGMDLGLSTDIQESFKLFQKRVYDHYDTVVAEEGLVRVDATKAIREQQLWVRNYISKHIELPKFVGQNKESHHG